MQQIKYLKILISLLLISSLSACSLFEPKVVEVPYFVEKSIPLVPKAKQTQMKKVYFYVVSDKNINAFKARFKKKHNNLVFVAISVKDYENLSSNVAELTRYIKDQQAVIEYYEESIQSKTNIKKESDE